MTISEGTAQADSIRCGWHAGNATRYRRAHFCLNFWGLFVHVLPESFSLAKCVGMPGGD
jgi:hypothetical protein